MVLPRIDHLTSTKFSMAEPISHHRLGHVFVGAQRNFFEFLAFPPNHVPLLALRLLFHGTGRVRRYSFAVEFPMGVADLLQSRHDEYCVVIEDSMAVMYRKFSQPKAATLDLYVTLYVT